MARRLNLAHWRDTNRLDADLFVSGFQLFGDELPGLQLHSTRPVIYPDFGLGAHTMWRGVGAEALLRIDHYETAARGRAHDLLVELLAGFESPLAGRRSERDLGDVAFADGPGSVVVFARGNLVVSARRAGLEPVAAWPAAARLDRILIARPSGAATAPRWVTAKPTSAGDTARIATAPGESEWLRIVSPTGRIHRDTRDRIVYRHDQDRPVEVTVYPRRAGTVIPPDR
jgi:hypothetical protein